MKNYETTKIIEPVNTPQPWISNTVTTPKTNGVMLRCSRNKKSCSLGKEFPIPALDSMIDEMSVQRFSQKSTFVTHIHKSNCLNKSKSQHFHFRQGVLSLHQTVMKPQKLVKYYFKLH